MRSGEGDVEVQEGASMKIRGSNNVLAIASFARPELPFHWPTSSEFIKSQTCSVAFSWLFITLRWVNCGVGARLLLSD